MNPVVKYYLARLALVAVIAVPLMFVVNVLAAFAAGFIGSLLISLVALRGQRTAMIDHVDASVRRRQEEKRRLRAELAGADAEQDAEADAKATKEDASADA